VLLPFCSKMNSLIGSLKHDLKVEEEESTLHLAEFVFQLLFYRQPTIFVFLYWFTFFLYDIKGIQIFLFILK